MLDVRSQKKKIISPLFMLASNYIGKNGKAQYSVNKWYMSEKLDGQRGLWDSTNETMYSRNGNVILIPEWFHMLLVESKAPDLDGELYFGTGTFTHTGIFRSKKIDLGAWKNVKYCVFDLPSNQQIFSERLSQLNIVMSQISTIFDTSSKSSSVPKICPIHMVKQIIVENKQHLQDYFNKIIYKGGEGIIFKNPCSYYKASRNTDMLKYKKCDDDEAEIIGYKMGRGKYTGKLGAFHVKNIKTGVIFTIAGMTDAVRNNYFDTHPIGTRICYTYFELTSTGKPRHPVYKGIRTDIFPDPVEIEPKTIRKKIVLKHPKKIVLKNSIVLKRSKKIMLSSNH